MACSKFLLAHLYYFCVGVDKSAAEGLCEVEQEVENSDVERKVIEAEWPAQYWRCLKHIKNILQQGYANVFPNF